jgi:kynurenine formamidase
MRKTNVLFAVALALCFAGSAAAQQPAEGPWWPHPIWGAGDQAGGSNWITPAKVLEAVRLIETGRVYELGHVYERGMPMFGQRTYAMFIPGSPTYSPMGKNALIGHDDFLCAEIGNVGTQFDGPGHIGTRLKMPDGSERDVFYNGVPIEEMRDAYGLRKLGVEHVKPIITRGILIDVAGYKGVESLPNSYEVTADDVRGALKRQGMSEEDIRPGDALFFRYGWERFWSQPEKYNQNPPGIGLAVARWAAERKASMVGSDQWTTEVVPNPDPELVFPVHQELLVKNGIFNLENMALDRIAADRLYAFAFIFTPVPFKGAAGSPGRPIAIR